MLLFSQGCCFIQSLLFSYVFQEDSVKFSRKFISDPFQPSGRSSHPVRTTICPLFHPSGRHIIPSRRPTDQASFVRIPSRPSLSREASVPVVSVRKSQQPVRTPLSTRLVSDSFQVQNKGRLIQTSGRHRFPSGRASP
jgi:hypothetical protein